MAADRAALLATDRADKAQAIAVARAIRDANVDRDLLEHTQQIAAINGSQRRAAASLVALEGSVKEIVISNQAVAEHLVATTAKQFSRRTWVVGILTAIASYLALFGFLLVNLH